MSTDTQDSAPAGVKPVAWMDKLISLVVAYGDSRHFEVEAVDKRDAVCRTTQAFADLMEHVRRAPVVTQPGLTQQTLDDVKASIPARDAEIEALRKVIEALQAQQDTDKVDAERYQAWRDALITGKTAEDDFIRLVADNLPISVGVSRRPTAAEWDAAIDAARKEQA